MTDFDEEVLAGDPDEEEVRPIAVKKGNRYTLLIERAFFDHYHDGDRVVRFDRDEFPRIAEQLGMERPDNLGDVVYTFRYRRQLPQSIRSVLSDRETWIIRGVDDSSTTSYEFVAVPIEQTTVQPRLGLAETKVPDSTPGLIAKYALSDEQALLAKLRYNRLVDIYTGVACYSLQNHLRTKVNRVQVETDEVYIGIDKRGIHYVFPVQAKGGKDVLNFVQIEQDVAMCALKFPDLVCRPIAAQFMGPDLIALFLFEPTAEGVALVSEKHYRLVVPAEVTAEDLNRYQARLEGDVE